MSFLDCGGAGRLVACALVGWSLGLGGAGAAGVDWATYGVDQARDADNAQERTLSVKTAPRLKSKWAVSVDGSALTAQVIVAHGLTVAGALKDLVYVATEHGTLAALDAATGAVVWSVNTGYSTVGCGDLPNGDFGITSPPVFSRADNRLYAMGGDGKLYAYNASTGAVLAGWPVTIEADPTVEHVYSALTLGKAGIYVATASMCDIPTYHGRVVSVSTGGTPAITASFYTDGSTATRPGPGGGGIWGPGGLSVASNGKLYVATGNLEGAAHEYDVYGDQIVALNPDLTVAAANYLSLPNPDGDVDWGSTPVLFQTSAGCPHALAAINKAPLVATYDANHVTAGATQTLPNNNDVGDVAFDRTSKLLVIANRDSLQAWQADATCQFKMTWQQSRPNAGQVAPPSIANGVIYYGNGFGDQLSAWDVRLGTALWSATLGGALFAAPTIVNGQVYQPSWDGKLYAFGL